ncbi:aliphatic sulfonate ABC transporter substrate-binding protein [Sphingosinicellaceae bacterium]|nr:aliphatic sulfonate ABC transporter substrate-binding protein [Sphingosinicellaceae bacterium]
MIDRRTLLIASAALAACSKRPRIRIGYQNGLLLIAKARGDLDDVAKVVWHGYAAGPPLLEAMSVGGIDLGGTGDTPPIVAQSQGARIVYVAAQPVSGAAAAILVPAGSKLQTAAELRGKRVAWLRGTSAERFVRTALAAAGLTPVDVEAVNLAPDDAAAAFAGGSLDAWAVWDPYFASAEVEHRARVLVGGASLAASLSFLTANADFAKAQPDTLRAVLSALKATAAWATTNRKGLADIMATAAGLTPHVAARVAARQDLALVPLDAAIMAAEQKVADALLAQGTIPARVDVATLRWNGWRG